MISLGQDITLWFIQSFILDNFDVELCREHVGQLGLRDLDEDKSALSSYVEFSTDDLLCESVREESATIEHPNIAGPVKCRLRQYFYFGPLGLCSQILSIKVDANGATALPPASLIDLTNLFEPPLVGATTPTMRTADGTYQSPTQVLAAALDDLIRRLPGRNNERPYRADADVGGPTGVGNPIRVQRPYIATVLRYESADLYHQRFLTPLETIISEVSDGSPKPRRPWPADKWARQLANHDPAAIGTALAALLYRFKTASQWYKIDPSYLRGLTATDERGFENYHPHQDIFVTLHTRSMLVGVNCETSESRSLFESFGPLLIATVADARAKWYALLFINSHIEAYAAALRSRTTIAATDILTAIYELRRYLIPVIDSTTSRKRSLSSLSGIFEQFNRIFGVAELRAQALQKVELVEKLYYNVQQLAMYETATRLPNADQEDQAEA